MKSALTIIALATCASVVCASPKTRLFEYQYNFKKENIENQIEKRSGWAWKGGHWEAFKVNNEDAAHFLLKPFEVAYWDCPVDNCGVEIILDGEKLENLGMFLRYGLDKERWSSWIAMRVPYGEKKGQGVKRSATIILPSLLKALERESRAQFLSSEGLVNGDSNGLFQNHSDELLEQVLNEIPFFGYVQILIEVPENLSANGILIRDLKIHAWSMDYYEESIFDYIEEKRKRHKRWSYGPNGREEKEG